MYLYDDKVMTQDFSADMLPYLMPLHEICPALCTAWLAACRVAWACDWSLSSLLETASSWPVQLSYAGSFCLFSFEAAFPKPASSVNLLNFLLTWCVITPHTNLTELSYTLSTKVTNGIWNEPSTSLFCCEKIPVNPWSCSNLKGGQDLTDLKESTSRWGCSDAKSHHTGQWRVACRFHTSSSRNGWDQWWVFQSSLPLRSESSSQLPQTLVYNFSSLGRCLSFKKTSNTHFVSISGKESHFIYTYSLESSLIMVVKMMDI